MAEEIFHAALVKKRFIASHAPRFYELLKMVQHIYLFMRSANYRPIDKSILGWSL